MGVGVPARTADFPPRAPGHLPGDLPRLLHVEDGEVTPAGQETLPPIPREAERGRLELPELVGEHLAAPPPA